MITRNEFSPVVAIDYIPDGFGNALLIDADGNIWRQLPGLITGFVMVGVML